MSGAAAAAEEEEEAETLEVGRKPTLEGTAAEAGTTVAEELGTAAVPAEDAEESTTQETIRKDSPEVSLDVS